ncbi:Membrane-associated progesterone receptor component 2 [Trichoplax sp. H2]|nr:Membrane-associated progesterone receptor component 2 [Trichoplax sp. H2]|eukprot:RDD41710.1 Membrane-associated progesterone receptor component 2 [Trichoplax sp. H2]
MLEFLEGNTSVNAVLIVAILFLVYKLFFSASGKSEMPEEKEEELPPMEPRDFTLPELSQYDGIKDKRVLMAINSKVFDVSRRRSVYGPGGPYQVFAGHDASRGLATFSLEKDAVKDEIDDLSDLNSMQMDSLREWEMQFLDRYPVVGKLLTPEEAAQREEELKEKQPEDAKNDQDSKKEK